MTEQVLNIERLTLLRDTIQSLDPSRFTMADWVLNTNFPQDLVHNCNTAGCIGGWAEGLFFPKDSNVHPLEVAEALGLDTDQKEILFFPLREDLPGSANISTITQAEAVETLGRLISTGNVDWSHVNPNPPQ